MKYGDLTRQEVVALLGYLNGVEAVRAILRDRELPEVKYGGETLGRWQALIDKLGGETVIQRVLSGELEIKIQEGDGDEKGSMVITPATDLSLFDRHGWRTRPRGLQAKASDSNWSFRLDQPTIDYAARLARLARYFPEGTVFPSAENFDLHTREILAWIWAHKQLSNLLEGDELKVVHLPLCLPQIEVSDYGQTLEKLFLAAAADSYRALYPDRKFHNHRQGELADQVSIVEGNRHEELVIKMTESPVVAVFFPNALQGYSIDAAREQMASLPGNILLGGGFDTITALTAYPDVLARDFHTPGLDLAALSWQSPRDSLHCEAYGGEFDFDSAGKLAYPRDYYSAGLLVLRQ